jgi:hypothetical protein
MELYSRAEASDLNIGEFIDSLTQVQAKSLSSVVRHAEPQFKTYTLPTINEIFPSKQLTRIEVKAHRIANELDLTNKDRLVWLKAFVKEYNRLTQEDESTETA